MRVSYLYIHKIKCGLRRIWVWLELDFSHPQINHPIHDPTDLKHLMAVMLLTRLARKAVVVVREVTNMDTRA